MNIGRHIAMSITARLAEFSSGIRYEDIPAMAVSGAKECILDCLGCMFAGSVEPVGKIVSDYVRREGGKRQARLMNRTFKSTAALAALANGTMAHALDYDDACVALPWHPTSSILPCLMALGESRRISGKELIESYTGGLEVAVRLGRAIFPNYMETGWHNTGTIGSIAAAASASRLLCLTTQQTLMALGIASSEASGLRKNFGTMTKPFHAGNSAKNGVTAAVLAGMGFSADDASLEGDLGLCASLGGSDELLEEMIKTLGAAWELVSPGITLKAYSSCYATHRCIDAVLRIKRQNQFGPDDIVEIQLETDPSVPQKLRYHQPSTPLQGKFSLEFCVSVAMLEGEAGLNQFTDEKIADSRVLNLLKKVKYVHDVVGEEGGSQADPSEGVTVKLRDGRKINQQVSAVKGHPQNPMSPEELKAKYRQCSSLVLSPDQTERSFALLSDLENMADINHLWDVIQPGK
jgi:2-methylcitrate dehydratase PrpD